MTELLNNDMGLIANDPITDELQGVALGAFRNADKAEGLRRGSRLALVFCLIAAWEAPVEAVRKNQKGETVFSHAFTVGQYCDPAHVVAACGDDAQSRGAMAKAVIERLSSVSDPSPAQKQALNAAKDVAFGLFNRLSDHLGEDATVPNVQALVTRTQRGSVTVPGFIMLKEPDAEKAAESAIETYKREADKPFVLDGTPKRSFNELSSRVKPKADREGSSGQGGGEAKTLSRMDAARVLIGSAAGGADWVEYFATLSGAEIVAMLKAFGDKDEDKSEAA